MKKLSFFCFSIALSLSSLYGQTEKKDPLVVVNGKISNILLDSINPNSIESISVTKSQSSIEDYGLLAEGGVISIITKDYQNIEDQNEQSVSPLVMVNGKVFIDNPDSIPIHEIESLSVLKGISATKLYGKAGKNGVIVITLKEKVNYNK